MQTTTRRRSREYGKDKFNSPSLRSGLNTFWRSVENVATKASGGVTWTVSFPGGPP